MITLRTILPKEQTIFQDLLQLYLAEIDSFLNKESSLIKDSCGRYTYEHNKYFVCKGTRCTSNFAYFIVFKQQIVGFVLITHSPYLNPTSLSIAELYISPPFRRLGLGSNTVNRIFKKHKGNYEIKPFPKNLAAVQFWEKTIKHATNNNYNWQLARTGQATSSKILVFEVK